MTDWDAYRFVLAVADAGSLAQAARRLRVDATTVGRRIAALERALSARLFDRRDRRMVPTALGNLVAARAAEAGAVLAAVKDAAESEAARAVGTVRLSSLPFLINHVLADGVPALARAHPGLRVAFAASSSNANLSRREADIALRYARPSAGAEIVCRRLGAVGYAVYAAKTEAARAEDLPWIGLDEEFSHLPEAAWIARRAAAEGQAAATVAEVETMRRLVAAGVGRSLLPMLVGDADAALARLSDRLIEREVWLLVHRDLRNLPRIRAVVDWIDARVAACLSGPGQGRRQRPRDVPRPGRRQPA
ncbi:MAG: LysR family transcriptional regulator [Rhodospirillaceae bacterium]|nr:LysR family transcriptional regulator [Rhodospirillaceae bacterium]